VIFAVVPIKSFDAAKTRLADRFDPEQRASFARASAERVLAAFARCRAVDRRLVVVDGDEAAALGRRHGFEVVMRPDLYGQSAAVAAGFDFAREAGAETVLTISADVPLTRPMDIEELLREPGPMILAVSNREGEGTNALRLSPAVDLPLHFGPGSLDKHRHEAAALGVTMLVVNNARLRLDVDTSGDLDALEATPDGRRVLVEAGKLLRDRRGDQMWLPRQRPA